MADPFSVRTAKWAEDAATLHDIRHEVFVIEQNVPPAIECDGQDPACAHVIAEDASGRAIACGRLLPDGHIGRMAVRREWRARGVGAALLQHLIALAQAAGHARVQLNAQMHATGFYARQGFAPAGEIFMEAGIAHQTMERRWR